MAASWLLFVMFNYVFVTFACSILDQMWYLIVSIPDLCQWFDNGLAQIAWFHKGHLLKMYDVFSASHTLKNTEQDPKLQ